MIKLCETCGDKHYARGLCKYHYAEARRYAWAGRSRSRAVRGEPLRWLRDRVGFNGDDCLIWPFFRDARSGYAKVYFEGKNVAACRVMCTMAHGTAPDGQPCALHTCGKGHLGCVHPEHLRWGTKLENASDRTKDGTELCGTAVWSARLKPEDVLAIKGKVSAGVRQADVAREYGINPSHVSKIVSGRKWRLALQERTRLES